MKKRLIVGMMAAFMVFGLTACKSEAKIVHCDNCGAEIKVSSSEKVEESWTVYCDDCNKELGIDEKIMEILEK